MLQLVHDNVRCLCQGIDLINSLPEGEYTRRHSECFGSTIGGHMRHNLDHYERFMQDWRSGRIDYDARSRDPGVESDPALALNRLLEIKAGLEAVGESDLDASVTVIMDSGGDPSVCGPSRSSVRRELQFLISHTVHHYALITVLCQLRGIETAPDFGVAPSTLRYRGQSSCAR
ncbi:DinB family protein [Ruficoccus sp. ZRK36]|uniref:DinB family protein n=1 Tax=Ruficoccus sp. ZRK36 TaxID=2866311 RepID=UPI001C73ADB0|nr:DinB family protein [Ruficoccus sp. ZRK36]QYY37341.1 DinB family protein [Ruficoccus sp. ZRK36]